MSSTVLVLFAVIGVLIVGVLLLGIGYFRKKKQATAKAKTDANAGTHVMNAAFSSPKTNPLYSNPLQDDSAYATLSRVHGNADESAYATHGATHNDDDGQYDNIHTDDGYLNVTGTSSGTSTDPTYLDVAEPPTGGDDDYEEFITL
jgi:hypothetical protein